ncbi:MAG: acyltransferase family protein [Burkholderiales bacterium]|nr:acyltransferase family protein [Phycisphaerae bacterium]
MPRRFDTSVLLAIAALLIINSHLEAYYPRPWMAADGLLGVSIFYMLSGFGVQCSLLGRKQSFLDYYARRLWRLYPAVIIVVLAAHLLRGSAITDMSPGQLFAAFIWPTNYTYVIWIVPFYAIIYFTGRGATMKRSLWILALLAIGYAASAVRDAAAPGFPAHLQLGNLSLLNQTMYYALAFFIGAALAVSADRIDISGRTWLLLGVMILIAVGLYVAAKYVMVVRGQGSAAFPVLHALVLFICVAAFFVTTHDLTMRPLRKVPLLALGITLLAAITLETYVVHQALAHWSKLVAIRFPLNIAALVGLTIALSIPLHLLINRLTPIWKNREKSVG